MDSILWIWLLQWRPWPQIILILVTLAVLYGRGWHRLRQRGSRRLANGWRLTSFMAGIGVLGLAMLSPIEVLQEMFFSVHMVQHLLIQMVGPPLLLLADPYPFLLWGLPNRARRAASEYLTATAPFRQVLRKLTSPWLCWGLYVGLIWVWHVPAAYDASLRSEVYHVLMHLSFFAPALLFWWHVTGAAPRLHGRLSYGLRVGLALAGLAQNEVLGVIIAFADEPLYSHYATVPRMWGLSVMEDQALGGALMWVPGGMMYVLTAIILLARMLEQAEKRAERELEQPKSVEEANRA